MERRIAAGISGNVWLLGPHLSKYQTRELFSYQELVHVRAGGEAVGEGGFAGGGEDVGDVAAVEICLLGFDGDGLGGDQVGGEEGFGGAAGGGRTRGGDWGEAEFVKPKAEKPRSTWISRVSASRTH